MENRNLERGVSTAIDVINDLVSEIENLEVERLMEIISSYE